MRHVTRWLRRFNVYLTTAAAVAIILGGLLLAALLARDQLRHGSVSGSVATERSVVRAETLTYGLRTSAEDLVVLDVASRQRVDYGYSSKDLVHALRNQRFVRLGDGRQTLLFPDNDQLIVSVMPVVAEGREPDPFVGPDRERAAVARVYTVVTGDTNDDGRLSGRDAKSVMIAARDGTRRVTLAEGLSEVSRIMHDPSGEVRLIANAADGSARIVRFDINAWRVLDPIALPLIAAAAGTR